MWQLLSSLILPQIASHFRECERLPASQLRAQTWRKSPCEIDFAAARGFIADARHHCRPIDRNERARILTLAEALERRTRPPGARNGVVSEIGLRVLRVLVLRFVRGSDGLCTPSYTVLQAATGLCRQSIANALKRLEAGGILRITRRLVREVIDAGGFPLKVCRQGSNLYAVFEPAEHAERLPVRSPDPRKFPGAMFAALVKTMGWRPSPPNRGKDTNLVFSKKRQAREVPLYGQNSPEVCF